MVGSNFEDVDVGFVGDVGEELLPDGDVGGEPVFGEDEAMLRVGHFYRIGGKNLLELDAAGAAFYFADIE